MNVDQIDLEIANNGVCSVRINDSSVVPVKNLIWTGSLNQLIEKLELNVPDILLRDLYLVYITFRKSRAWKPSPFIYIYHPDKDFLFARSYYPSNIFNDHSTDIDGVCLEVHGVGPVLGMELDEIRERCITDAVKCGMFTHDQIQQVHMEKYRDSIPIYSLDYRDRIDEIRRKLNVFKNVIAIGKPGSLYYCLSKSTVNHGLQAAEHILNRSVSPHGPV